MGREKCLECHFIGKTMFCDYYDFGFFECSDLDVCPGGYDDDEEEYDDGWCDDERDM